MIELHTQNFETITLNKGVNVFTFTHAEQSETFLAIIEEAFHKRKKSSKLFLIEEGREKEPKDYTYIETSIGKHAQEIKLHEVLIEKLVYDFYHDETQMKAYYDFQCQYQMFLNQLEITQPEYSVLFHAENFQEKVFLKQLEFDVTKQQTPTNASDRLKIYCDTKLSIREQEKEPITVITYPETEFGLLELSQLAEYVANLPGYVIIVTNMMKYFSRSTTRYNLYNREGIRVEIESLLSEYRLFDPYVTLMDVIHIVEYCITGNQELMGKRYAEMVKSSGIDDINML